MVAVAVVLVAVVDSMEPTVESNAVLISLIGTIGTVLVALTGVAVALVGRTNNHARQAAVSSRAAAQDSALARDQVTNNHTSNMREENDERHQEILDLFAQAVVRVDLVAGTQVEQTKRLDSMASDQRGMRKDVGRLSDSMVDLGRRQGQLGLQLHDIELKTTRREAIA